MGDFLQTGKPSRYITNAKVNLDFDPSGMLALLGLIVFPMNTHTPFNTKKLPEEY